MADNRRGRFMRGLKRFRWGEATLWAIFAVLSFSGVSGTSGENQAALTLAGIFALAAIGVRATRADANQPDDQH